MRLVSVYDVNDTQRHKLLWDLMSERDDTINISHRKMPSWDDHVRFVESHPYSFWCFIESGDTVVGAGYLTERQEIWVGIFKEYHGKGYGPEAVAKIIGLHGPARYLANINHRNGRSREMLEKLGFRKIQETYEYEYGGDRGA